MKKTWQTLGFRKFNNNVSQCSQIDTAATPFLQTIRRGIKLMAF